MRGGGYTSLRPRRGIGWRLSSGSRFDSFLSRCGFRFVAGFLLNDNEMNLLRDIVILPLKNEVIIDRFIWISSLLLKNSMECE